jgi:hypothetical protein
MMPDDNEHHNHDTSIHPEHPVSTVDLPLDLFGQEDLRVQLGWEE